MPAEQWIAELERDGFVVARDFFSQDEVEQARKELAPLANPQHKGPYENVMNVFGRSPALDRMVERILTDPESSKLMHALAGPHIKLRGYNVRRMTGEFNPADNLNPAMDWHQDAPAEFCLAIFIEEPMDTENAATAAIPGSHWLPYDPRWNCMFGSPFIWLDGKRQIHYAPRFLRHFNLLSRALARRVQKNATGITGKPGDFYIFVNDVWHGRCPNLHGKKGSVVQIGGFPTDIPFPDEVPVPAADVLDKLPPVLRAAAAQTNPVQPGQSSLAHRLFEHRRTVRPTGLFLLAKIERKIAEAITRLLLAARLTLGAASPPAFKTFVRRLLGRPAR